MVMFSSRADAQREYGFELSNVRNSWGGANHREKIVYLTAWADRKENGEYPIALPWKDINGKVKSGYPDALRLLGLVSAEGYRLRLLVSVSQELLHEYETRQILYIRAAPFAVPYENKPGEWWAFLGEGETDE